LQVSTLAARLKQAEKDAALYNSREALFGKPATDYSEVRKLGESFEPYQQFWSIAAAWKVCSNTIILETNKLISYVILA
jgi:dynein heavy chain